MKRILIFWSIIFCSYISFAQEPVETKSLLPEDGDVPNWNLKDSVETYLGEDLFMYINGGADLYLEYGFDEVAAGRYMNFQSNSILVDVYKMSSIDAAYGVFTLSSTSKGKPQMLGDQSFLYDYYLDLWKGPYFIRFTANKKDNGMIDTLMLFAKTIVPKISINGKKPQLTQAFHLPGFEITNLKYITGIVGLNNIFNFGHGSIAGFSEGLYAKWEDKFLFVFAYEDGRKRREWFASAKGKMQMSKKFSNYTAIYDGFSVTDKAGNFFSFKPYSKYILVVKGLGWEEAKAVFEKIQANLDTF